MNLHQKFVIGVTFISALAGAAETAVEFSTKPIGTIDLRPSYTSKTGEFHTENSVELGAQLTEDVSLSFVQAVNTNIYDPALSAESSGLNVVADVGFIRTRVSKIFNDEASGLSLGYQNRVYVPTNQGARDAGQIAAVRNYFTLNKKVSDVLSLSVTEMPVLFAHNHSGYLNASGVATANQAFENRVYLMASFTLSEKLSLDVPLMFHQTKMRNFRADAATNDDWKFLVWINPELTYQIDPTYTAAIGYYSDNLVSSDLAKFVLGDGLEKGVVQISLAASL